MRNKICPRCGCIFDEEKLKCIDCDELLRTATDAEITAYEQKANKGLEKASVRSEATSPAPWQYIAVASLMAYSFIVELCFGGGWALIAFNALFCIALMFPKFDFFVNRDKRGKRIWCKIYYPQFRYKLLFGTVVIINLFLLVGIIFKEQQKRPLVIV